jgi:hypothetical protein
VPGRYDSDWYRETEDFFHETVPPGLMPDMLREDFQSFSDMLKQIDYGIDVRSTLGWAELEERWGEDLNEMWDWEDFREWYDETH